MPERKPKSTPSSSKPRKSASSASRLIDEKIASLPDWRGTTLAEVRRLIHEADPDIVEETKWAKASNPQGVPVWSHGGIVCTGEVYKDAVKLTFMRGASLDDPKGLFNSSLDGNTRLAIDIHEGEMPEAKAFRSLILAAVAANLGADTAKSKPTAKAKPSATPVKLLSGGNPQIAKGDGDVPVQAYIAAMPGWKSDVGKRLDALIVQTIPDVRKAVKWNSPFYGIEGQGWFLGVHCYAKYIKIAFFKGASLKPLPPGESKQKDVRYLDIRENDPIDEKQFASWVLQAAAIPGWIP